MITDTPLTVQDYLLLYRLAANAHDDTPDIEGMIALVVSRTGMTAPALLALPAIDFDTLYREVVADATRRLAEERAAALLRQGPVAYDERVSPPEDSDDDA